MISILLASAQPSISLDLGVVGAGRAVEALGRASGQKMRAAGGAEQSFLFVKVKSEPLEDVKSALARATGGRWEEKDKVWTLRGSQTRTQAYQALLRQSFADWMRKRPSPESLTQAGAKAVNSLRAEAFNPTNWGKWEANLDDLAWSDPAGRLIRRLTARLGAGIADGLEDRERRLFSLNPRPGARPLPPAARNDLQALIRETRMMRAALPPDQQERWRLGSSAIQIDKMTEAEIGSLDFAISREQARLKLNVWISHRQTGEFVIDYGAHIQGPELAADPNEKLVPPEFPVAQNVPLPPVDPQAASARLTLTEALASARGETRGRAIPAPARQMLAAMEQKDPLDIVASPALDQLQRRLGRSLVASVPDTWFRRLLGRAVPAPKTVGEVLEHLQRGTFGAQSLAVERVGDIQVLTPANLAWDRAARFEREPLAGLVRDLMAGRSLLDSRAGALAKMDHHRTVSLEWHFIKMITGVPISSVASMDQLVLPIYGGLSDQEKKLARGKDGLALSLRSGRPAQARLLERLFTYDGLAIMQEFEPARRDPSGFQIPERGYDPDANRGSYRLWIPKSFEMNPLLAHPAGIPSGTRIVLRVWSDESLLGYSERGTNAENPSSFSVDRLARSIIQEENRPGESSKFVPEFFYEARHHDLGLAFRLPGARRLDARADVQELPAPGRLMRYSQLPKALRDSVDRRVAELRKGASARQAPRRVSPP